MAELLQAIQAGGNVALMAIAVAIYRMDRRLFAVELKLNILEERHNGETR